MSTDLAIFLATSGHSGVDRVMRNLVPAFAAHGLRIDLLRVRGHGPHWEDLPENVRLIDLGSRHVYGSLPALLGYLRRQRPRVLLSDKDRVNRTALLARMLAGVDTRVAVRIGTTVSKNLERRTWWARIREFASIRLFYRHAQHILSPSRGAAEDLARIAGLPVGRIAVVRSPVVNERLTRLAAEPAGHPWLEAGAPPVILGVGELCGRKDFSTLVRAFARLRRQRACRLIVAGEGRHRQRLLGLAQELGVSEDVDLPGFVVNPYAYMSRARVFALTSTCEGMPVVLIEAMALGTPVAATDCPSGPREILDGGRYGPLVAVGDAETLAARLGELLDHPTSPDLLRAAVQDYTVERSVESYLHALGLSSCIQGPDA